MNDLRRNRRLEVRVNPLFYRHETGPSHPETAWRLDAAVEGVRRAGRESSLISHHDDHPDTDRLIAKVHSTAYSKALDEACLIGERLFHCADNPISSATWDAARAAVSTSLVAIDRLHRTDESDRAFVIARPPGHHAERERAMGFCFFNTIACVSERLLESPSIERVFVLDWDVHHGNGTQHLFEERDDVFYLSIHQHPFYPGSGAPEEVGRGRGAGFTRNFPLPAGSGDREYLDLFESDVLPLIDEYAPHAIVISAGFDAHARDPIGGMRLTEAAFGTMTRLVSQAADRHCNGKLFGILEGGYDAEALEASVAEHIIALEES